MKHLLLTQSLITILTCTCAAASPGPTVRVPIVAIVAPQDRPYPGILTLNVDLSDIDRKVVRVHETLSAVTANTVLLYPEWLPGTHAPQGPIDRFAGLKITSGGAAVAWMRDPIEIHAFRLKGAPIAETINIEFEYLAPTSTKVGHRWLRFFGQISASVKWICQPRVDDLLVFALRQSSSSSAG